MNQSGAETRIAVLVPGIMGSSLRYAGEPYELWSSNFRKNYEKLATNASALSWSKKRAEASFMTSASFSVVLPLHKQDLWGETIREVRRIPALRNNIHQYGYDWRASLVETAPIFTRWLEERTGASVGAPRPPDRPAVTFICHSMGGLLARIAVGVGALHPSWIFQMINIGSPLLGSPTAFRTAYDRSGLPGLTALINIVRAKHSTTYFESLRSAFTTFPSLYQLFPPTSVPILFFGPQRARKSPLKGAIVSSEMKDHVSAAQDALRDANEIFVKEKTEVYVIYNDLLNAPPTEFEYDVEEVNKPVPRYIIRRTYAAGNNGDGTVPEYSARSPEGGAIPRDVHQVEHSCLCNSTQVRDELAGILK